MRPHEYFLFSASAHTYSPDHTGLRAGSPLHVKGMLVELLEKNCCSVYISFIEWLRELDEVTHVRCLTLST